MALIEEATSGSDKAATELQSRFDDRLAFGTAGIRGELAAGPNRMNHVLVAQAVAGLTAGTQYYNIRLLPVVRQLLRQEHTLRAAHATDNPNIQIS